MKRVILLCDHINYVPVLIALFIGMINLYSVNNFHIRSPIMRCTVLQHFLNFSPCACLVFLQPQRIAVANEFEESSFLHRVCANKLIVHILKLSLQLCSCC